MDIQPIELAAAIRAHAEGGYSKHPTLLDIENLSTRFPLKGHPNEKQIYVFLGGTYGNFRHEIINTYLEPLLEEDITLIISMPIITGGKTDEEIMGSYVGSTFENMILGPLSQVGFHREDFKLNEKYSDIITHFDMVERSMVSSLILRKPVKVFDRSFETGTKFQLTTSWKPTLEEFRAALEMNFTIEKVFHNKDMAMAVIQSVK